MKILIINSLYEPYRFGGAEVSVRMLAEELAKNNEVRVITLNHGDEITRSILNGVSVVSLPLSNIYWPFNSEYKGRFRKLIWHLKDFSNPKMKKMVGLEIDSFNPDIVHTNNIAGFSVSVWNAIKERNIPLVHTTRDYYLFHPNSTLFDGSSNMNVNSLTVRAFSWLKKYKSRKVDYLVGISEYITNLHMDNGFFKGKKSSYIYNPIKEMQEIKKNNLGGVSVGFLGRLTSEKGFDVFINYAKKYKDKFKFIAAGKVDSNENSKILYDEAEQAGIILLGYVEPSVFYSEIDVLLLPTKWNEPFGRVVAETAMAGISVFTNMNGGVKELSSLFSNIYKVEDFNNFNNFNNFNDVTASKGLNDEILIKKSFDVEVIADEYYKIYMSLTGDLIGTSL